MFTKFCRFALFLLLITSPGLFAQTTSETTPKTVASHITYDGKIYFHTSLNEAFKAVVPGGTDVIILLTDVVLDEPLTTANNVHIMLVTEGADRTISRSINLMEYPVIWVIGENSSLTLGRPDMANELIIDGGSLNEPQIKAHAPLVAVNGQDAKFIMHDGVTLQNNYNIADVLSTNYYQNGAGVIVRTIDDNTERQTEFIMRGGTIRGNTNNVNPAVSSGGGVLVIGFGIFTMEGGVIMNNTATRTGGGVNVGSRGSFKKTGGIIYGSKAPAGYSNITYKTDASLKYFGHAVYVAIFNPVAQFRNDTVYENDNLSYIGVPRGNGVFGEGENWDNPDKVMQRRLFVIIPIALALSVLIFFVIRIIIKKQIAKILVNEPSQEINLESFNLSPREKEICKLLLTKLSMKQIASVLNLTYNGVTFHVRNLYQKMNVQSRTELIVKIKQ